MSVLFLTLRLGQNMIENDMMKLAALSPCGHSRCTYLCGTHRRDIRACAWEAGIEFSRGAIGVSAVAWCYGFIDALASITSDTVVSRGVQNRDTHQAKLHVFVALALLVLWSQIRLIVTIGRGDDFGCGVATTVLWALVASVRVWVGGILDWVVTAIVCAVTTIDGVQEVVEGCAFNKAADLVKSDFLGIH